MSDTIRRVRKCAECSRMVTEGASGSLVSHKSTGTTKCLCTKAVEKGPVRYRATVDVGDARTGRRQQKTITATTKTEVRAEIDRIRHERRTGTYVTPTKITLNEWLDQWMATKREDLEESSIRGYENYLAHVRDHLGDLPLQDLTESDVEGMISHLLTKGRKRGGASGTGLRVPYVDGILGRLRQALRVAVQRQLVYRNVAEHVSVPRRARKQDRINHRPEPWTVEEIKIFLSRIKDDRLFPCVLLSLMGLRPAEVAGLRWENVDLEAGWLKITETRTMIGNSLTIEKDTKTEAGERQLPLPAAVSAALQSFQVLQEAEQITASDHGWYDPTYSGHVLVDQHGVHIDTRQLRERVYLLMRDTGMRKVRLYDARSSCLTFLATKGVPDVVLAAWAGHANAAFTKRVYVKPSVADLKIASDALADLFA